MGRREVEMGERERGREREGVACEQKMKKEDGES